MQTNKTLLITEIFHYFSVVSACAHVCVCEDTYKSKPFLAKVRSWLNASTSEAASVSGSMKAQFYSGY